MDELADGCLEQSVVLGGALVAGEVVSGCEGPTRAGDPATRLALSLMAAVRADPGTPTGLARYLHPTMGANRHPTTGLARSLLTAVGANRHPTTGLARSLLTAVGANRHPTTGLASGLLTAVGARSDPWADHVQRRVQLIKPVALPLFQLVFIGTGEFLHENDGNASPPYLIKVSVHPPVWISGRILTVPTFSRGQTSCRAADVHLLIAVVHQFVHLPIRVISGHLSSYFYQLVYTYITTSLV